MFDKKALQQLITYYHDNYRVPQREIAKAAGIKANRLNHLLGSDRIKCIRESEIDAIWGLEEKIENGELALDFNRAWKGFGVQPDLNAISQLVEYYKEKYSLSRAEIGEATNIKHLTSLANGGRSGMWPEEIDALWGLEEKIENGEYEPRRRKRGRKARKKNFDKDAFVQLIGYYQETYGISALEIAQMSNIQKNRFKNLLYGGNIKNIKEEEVNTLWCLDERIESGEFELEASKHAFDQQSLSQLLSYYQEAYHLTVADIARLCEMKPERLYNLKNGDDIKTMRASETNAIWQLEEKIDEVMIGSRQTHLRQTHLVFDKEALMQLIGYYQETYNLSVANIAQMANIPLARLESVVYHPKSKRIRREDLDVLWELEKRIEDDEFGENVGGEFPIKRANYDQGALRQLLGYYQATYNISIPEIARISEIKEGRLKRLIYAKDSQIISQEESDILWQLDGKIKSGEFELVARDKKNSVRNVGKKRMPNQYILNKANVRSLLSYYKETYGLIIGHVALACNITPNRLRNLITGEKSTRIQKAEADALWALGEKIESGEFDIEEFKERINSGEYKNACLRKKVNGYPFDRNNLNQLISYYQNAYHLSVADIARACHINPSRLNDLRNDEEMKTMTQEEVYALCSLDDKIGN